MTPVRPLAAVFIALALPACGGGSTPAPKPVPTSEPAPPAQLAPAETPKPAPTEAPQPTPTPPKDDAPAPDETENTAPGRVVVRVVFQGDLPTAKALQPDPATSVGCDHHGPMQLEDRTVVVKDGRVANAVLQLERSGYVVDGKGQVVTVDQRGCRFEPHVQIAPMGAELHFLNSDPMNHNVHAYPRKNTLPNLNVAPGTHAAFQVPRDDEIRVTCDIHPWMSSYVLVVESPFAGISGAAGEVVFEGVPAGEYKLDVWHEKLELVSTGRRRTAPKVEVKPGETTEIEVALEP